MPGGRGREGVRLAKRRGRWEAHSVCRRDGVHLAASTSSPGPEGLPCPRSRPYVPQAQLRGFEDGLTGLPLPPLSRATSVTRPRGGGSGVPRPVPGARPPGDEGLSEASSRSPDGGGQSHSVFLSVTHFLPRRVTRSLSARSLVDGPAGVCSVYLSPSLLTLGLLVLCCS